jgi:hypothetical protein
VIPWRTERQKDVQNKPVAGSQFLGGHCRKNVTEADLPTSNSNKSGDLIESFLRLTLNSGDKIFFFGKLFLAKIEYDYEPQVLIFYGRCSTVYHVSQPFKMEIKRLLQ